MRRVAVFLLALSAAGPAAAGQGETANLISAGLYVLDFNGDSGELTGPFTPPGVEARPVGTQAFALNYTRFIGGGFAVSVSGGWPPRYTLVGAGTIAGAGKLGDTLAVAPAVLLQKHVGFGPGFSGFVGAGAGYAWFTDAESTPTLDAALGGPTALRVEGRVFPAFEAGLTYDLTRRMVATAAFGYAPLKSDVHLTTGPIEREIEVTLDPFVYRLSIGWRF